MVAFRVVERPAFTVAGRQTWISGPNNDEFGAFWGKSRSDGFLERLSRLSGMNAGAQTGGVLLGISRVEADPAKRDFFYMIAVELPVEAVIPADFEYFSVPASTWAVFECRGPVPDAIVQAEMFAFMEWLPASGCEHNLAPEMEVYSADQGYTEFWLPVRPVHPME